MRLSQMTLRCVSEIEGLFNGRNSLGTHIGGRAKKYRQVSLVAQDLDHRLFLVVSVPGDDATF